MQDIEKPEASSLSAMTQSQDLDIKALIHTIRGRQVMLDSDLSMLYRVETKVFNQVVKRNERRFPIRFRFQLSEQEYEILKSQNVTSSGWGGRRKLPFAFTEQGVAMLSAVLRSEEAVKTSIAIMDAFVRMRRLLADNDGLFQRIDLMETRQLEYQHYTDERFERVFGCLEAKGLEHAGQWIFFEGQVYDAFELLAKLVRTAERELVLVDGYVSLDTLNVLAKKREGVKALVCATARGSNLTSSDIQRFNS